MVTSTRILDIACGVAPLSIKFWQQGQRVTVLDARLLRINIEHTLGRALLWEEWMDARLAYCRKHEARLKELVLNQPDHIGDAATLAAQAGEAYLLLDLVAPG